jgi:hypothetical protein
VSGQYGTPYGGGAPPYGGQPYPGPPGYGPPPPGPPPPQKPRTGLVVLTVAGVIVVLLAIVAASSFFYLRANPTTASTAGPSQPVPSVVSTSGGGTVGANHVPPTDGCAPVDLKTFETTLKLTKDTSTSPNPSGKVDKYGTTLVSSDCRGVYDPGDKSNPFPAEVSLNITVYTTKDPKGFALKTFTDETKSSVYGPPVQVPGVGEKATKFQSKVGNYELYVLDGNTIFDLKYSGLGIVDPKAGKAYEAALIVLVKTALSRTAKK